MKFRLIAAVTSLASVAIGVALLLGEATLRLYQLIAYDVPFSNNLQQQHSATMSPITLDDELGWRAAPNFRYDGYSTDLDGSVRTIHVTSNTDGFRAFGQMNSGRAKILVIGDSFTQATDVSDDATYYSVLGKHLGAEIFAYGANGYGTLQEYMILDKYLDEINPDLVILQFCPNDYINNSLDLELASKTSNNGMIRPYWRNGQIEYLLPSPHPRLRTFGLKYSRLTYLIFSRWDMIEASLAAKKADALDAIEQFDAGAVLHAEDITRELVKKLRMRVGRIPVIAFSSARRSESDIKFKKLSEDSGISFIDGVGLSVQMRQERGVTVRVRDGHWNETGHRVVAEKLSDYIHDNKEALVNSQFNHSQ